VPADRPEITVRPAAVGGSSQRPAPVIKPGQLPPPDIPAERPESAAVRNRIVKTAVKWAARIVLRTALGPPGHLLTLIEVASWLYDYYPTMRSYFDPPKTLEELQAAARFRKEGYELHHIVESGPALKDGFPVALVESPENRVLIPTLKHREITAWYMKRNEAYGWLTPREYLRGRSWQLRTALGLHALVIHGVLVQ
jgi:hypothetical protein